MPARVASGGMMDMVGSNGIDETREGVESSIYFSAIGWGHCAVGEGLDDFASGVGTVPDPALCFHKVAGKANADASDEDVVDEVELFHYTAFMQAELWQE